MRIRTKPVYGVRGNSTGRVIVDPQEYEVVRVVKTNYGLEYDTGIPLSVEGQTLLIPETEVQCLC